MSKKHNYSTMFNSKGEEYKIDVDLLLHFLTRTAVTTDYIVVSQGHNEWSLGNVEHPLEPWSRIAVNLSKGQKFSQTEKEAGITPERKKQMKDMFGDKMEVLKGDK